MFLSPWRTQFGVLCLLYSYPALLSQPIAIYWAPGIYKTWCWSLRQSHSFPGQLWTMPTNSAQCLEPWQKFPAVPVWGPWVGPAGEVKERSCGAGICLQAFPLTHRRVRGGRVGSSLPSTSRNQGRLDSQAQFLLAADLGSLPKDGLMMDVVVFRPKAGLGSNTCPKTQGWLIGDVGEAQRTNSMNVGMWEATAVWGCPVCFQCSLGTMLVCQTLERQLCGLNRQNSEQPSGSRGSSNYQAIQRV